MPCDESFQNTRKNTPNVVLIPVGGINDHFLRSIFGNSKVVTDVPWQQNRVVHRHLNSFVCFQNNLGNKMLIVKYRAT